MIDTVHFYRARFKFLIDIVIIIIVVFFNYSSLQFYAFVLFILFVQKRRRRKILLSGTDVVGYTAGRETRPSAAAVARFVHVLTLPPDDDQVVTTSTAYRGGRVRRVGYATAGRLRHAVSYHGRYQKGGRPLIFFFSRFPSIGRTTCTTLASLPVRRGSLQSQPRVSARSTSDRLEKYFNTCIKYFIFPWLKNLIADVFRSSRCDRRPIE